MESSNRKQFENQVHATYQMPFQFNLQVDD
jgi:hypothetical protein